MLAPGPPAQSSLAPRGPPDRKDPTFQTRRIHIPWYMHVFVHVCIHISVYIYIYMYIYIYVCIYIYTYRTYIHRILYEIIYQCIYVYLEVFFFSNNEQGPENPPLSESHVVFGAFRRAVRRESFGIHVSPGAILEVSWHALT